MLTNKKPKNKSTQDWEDPIILQDWIDVRGGEVDGKELLTSIYCTNDPRGRVWSEQTRHQYYRPLKYDPSNPLHLNHPVAIPFVHQGRLSKLPFCQPGTQVTKRQLLALSGKEEVQYITGHGKDDNGGKGFGQKDLTGASQYMGYVRADLKGRAERLKTYNFSEPTHFATKRSTIHPDTPEERELTLVFIARIVDAKDRRSNTSLGQGGTNVPAYIQGTSVGDDNGRSTKRKYEVEGSGAGARPLPQPWSDAAGPICPRPSDHVSQGQRRPLAGRLAYVETPVFNDSRNGQELYSHPPQSFQFDAPYHSSGYPLVNQNQPPGADLGFQMPQTAQYTDVHGAGNPYRPSMGEDWSNVGLYPWNLPQNQSAFPRYGREDQQWSLMSQHNSGQYAQPPDSQVGFYDQSEPRHLSQQPSASWVTPTDHNLRGPRQAWQQSEYGSDDGSQHLGRGSGGAFGPWYGR